MASKPPPPGKPPKPRRSRARKKPKPPTNLSFTQFFQGQFETHSRPRTATVWGGKTQKNHVTPYALFKERLHSLKGKKHDVIIEELYLFILAIPKTYGIAREKFLKNLTTPENNAFDKIEGETKKLIEEISVKYADYLRKLGDLASKPLEERLGDERELFLNMINELGNNYLILKNKQMLVSFDNKAAQAGVGSASGPGSDVEEESEDELSSDEDEPEKDDPDGGDSSGDDNDEPGESLDDSNDSTYVDPSDEKVRREENKIRSEGQRVKKAVIDLNELSTGAVDPRNHGKIASILKGIFDYPYVAHPVLGVHGKDITTWVARKKNKTMILPRSNRPEILGFVVTMHLYEYFNCFPELWKPEHDKFRAEIIKQFVDQVIKDWTEQITSDKSMDRSNRNHLIARVRVLHGDVSACLNEFRKKDRENQAEIKAQIETARTPAAGLGGVSPLAAHLDVRIAGKPAVSASAMGLGLVPKGSDAERKRSAALNVENSPSAETAAGSVKKSVRFAAPAGEDSPPQALNRESSWGIEGWDTEGEDVQDHGKERKYDVDQPKMPAAGDFTGGAGAWGSPGKSGDWGRPSKASFKSAAKDELSPDARLGRQAAGMHSSRLGPGVQSAAALGPKAGPATSPSKPAAARPVAVRPQGARPAAVRPPGGGAFVLPEVVARESRPRDRDSVRDGDAQDSAADERLASTQARMMSARGKLSGARRSGNELGSRPGAPSGSPSRAQPVVFHRLPGVGVSPSGAGQRSRDDSLHAAVKPAEVDVRIGELKNAIRALNEEGAKLKAELERKKSRHQRFDQALNALMNKPPGHNFSTGELRSQRQYSRDIRQLTNEITTLESRVAEIDKKIASQSAEIKLIQSDVDIDLSQGSVDRHPSGGKLRR